MCCIKLHCSAYEYTLTVNIFSSTIAHDVDYTSMNGYVVFAVGEFMKNITIPILVDSETEEVEIFNVVLAVDCCADVITGQVQVKITEANCNGM